MSSISDFSSIDGARGEAERRGGSGGFARGEPTRPEPVTGDGTPGVGGISRRRWLELMGASLALAGVGGCRWQREEIVPLAERPVESVPGQPQWYSTVADVAGAAVGLVVKTVDGRPIKVDGNARHPQSLGGSTPHLQASILQLYDPDRSRHVRQRTPGGGQARDWERFVGWLEDRLRPLKERRGAGLAVLAEACSSPTLMGLRQRLLDAMPEAEWYEYEPLADDNLREGARLAFGKPYRMHLALDRADVIVSLEADLLHFHPASLQYARQCAVGRRPESGSMNRLYVAESGLSVTGAAADHRLALPSGAVADMAVALEGALRDTPPGGFEGTEPAARFLQATAADLAAHRGRSAVVAGPGQPPEVHWCVHRINRLLDNVGNAVLYFPDPQPERLSHGEAIRTLVEGMNAGRVQMLVILGGNPVYNAPADLEFAQALTKVAASVHLSQYEDETSQRCQWHVPQAHFLEAWGDGRSWDGTYSVAQPLIEPLGGGRSALEVVAAMLGQPDANAYELVRRTFRELSGVSSEDEEALWRETLHEGLLANSAWKAETPRAAEPPEPLPRARLPEPGRPRGPGG